MMNKKCKLAIVFMAANMIVGPLLIVASNSGEDEKQEDSSVRSIDVVMVRQPDGQFKSGTFYLRFPHTILNEEDKMKIISKINGQVVDLQLDEISGASRSLDMKLNSKQSNTLAMHLMPGKNEAVFSLLTNDLHSWKGKIAQ